MRKFTLLVMALVMSLFSANAQTVATFETLSLPGADTFYVNHSSFGNDVGFDDGLAHFPCVFDTSFGYTFLSWGFVYSNVKDSVTSGFGNQFAAKPGGGQGSSDQYLVSWGADNYVTLKGAAAGSPVAGFYVANNTYAFNGMRDGDAFTKKFGGPNGTDADWFKLVVRGYMNDTFTKAVQVYLGDYRRFDNHNDELLNGWKWVNLMPLGNVDSLSFHLSSTDTGQFGMNTPAYFCMDNFTTAESLSVGETAASAIAKIFPNPAVNELFVQLNDNKVKRIVVYDVAGRMVAGYDVKSAVTSINTSAYVPGLYSLQLVGDEGNTTVRFVKQ